MIGPGFCCPSLKAVAFVLQIMEPDSGGVASQTQALPGLDQLQFVEHSPHVYLQPPRHHPHKPQVLLGQGWWLVHALTHEKQQLPQTQGLYELQADTLGFSVVHDSSTKQCTDVNDVFTKHLLSDKDGQMYVLAGKSVCRLSEMQVKYKEVRLEVAVGPTRAKHVIQGIALLHPLHQGCRFLWSAISVYKVLCLTQYKGEASKWAYEMGDSWKGRLLEFGITGQVFKSARVASHEGSGLTDGFAPFPCFSTLALLHLLSRWGTCAPKKGGFRTAENKAAANVLLEALLKESLSGRKVELEVDGGSSAGSQHCQWPLKPCTPSLVLPVSACNLELQAWKACVEAPLSCPALLLSWWKKCGLGVEGAGIPLFSILKRSLDDCPALHAQLLSQLTAKCEQGIYLALSPHKDHPSALIGCSFVSVIDAMDHPNRLNNHLLRHVYAGVEESRRFLNVSLCNDKASCSGVTLDAGVLAWPNNKCALAVPQAFLVCLYVCIHRYSFT